MRSLHTEMVLELLRDEAERPIGDAQAPKTENLVPTDYPYAVVYEHDTFDFMMSGPITDTQADKDLMYTIVSVGLNARQCREMAERVSEIMFSGELFVPGFRIQDVQFDLMGTVLRDTDIRPPVFARSDRYRIKSTPTRF